VSAAVSYAPAPGFAEFRGDYEQGRGHLLWTRSVADLETPVAAYLKLAEGKPYAFLLESVEGGASRGRYSIIGLAPDLIWRSRDGQAEINRNARSAPFAFTPDERAPLASLRALTEETRLTIPDGLPPMAGGLVGYFGYDMVRQMERLPAKNSASIDVPDAILVRPTLFAIFDNITDLLTLAAPVFPRADVTAAQAWEAAQGAIAAAEAALSRPLPLAAPPVALPPLPEPSSNFTKAGFMAAVERAKEYVFAGDVFQVVPSQRFSVPFGLPPFSLYRALRPHSPAPVKI
jgi:anthranilate synthase component 1